MLAVHISVIFRERIRWQIALSPAGDFSYKNKRSNRH
jgi:hypothetical protein